MRSFDAALRQLVDEFRGQMKDDDIVAILKDEIESLRDVTQGGDGIRDQN